jgi:hypothetical protein
VFFFGSKFLQIDDSFSDFCFENNENSTTKLGGSIVKIIIIKNK